MPTVDSARSLGDASTPVRILAHEGADPAPIPAATPCLEVQDLCVTIGGRKVVSGLTFRVDEGRRVGLLGASGSGKSLTAAAILGLLPSNAVATGSIRVNGAEVLGVPLARRPDAARAAMVFQDSAVALNPLVRLRDQLVEPLRRHRGLGRAEAQRAATLLAESIGLPEPEQLLSRYSGELSGGQRQRVCIALALACQTRLVIADEPTTALDVLTQQRVLDLLRTYTAGEGAPSLFFITHDVAVASQLCTDVIVMREGQLIESGTIDEVLARPRHEYTREIVSVAASAPQISAVTPRTEVRRDGRPESHLRLEHVSRAYAGPRQRFWHAPAMKPALHATTLTIGAGERVGVVGASGSGKTTLLRLILALERADSGTVCFDGRPIEPATARKLRWYRRRVQYIPQDPASTLDPLMSVRQLITEPLARLDVPGDHQSMLRAALLAVGLDDSFLGRRAGELSGGQAQRVAIARAVATGPELLLADEPVSGLDPPLREQVVSLLKRISADRGTGLLLVSHDISVVGGLCERTLVMSEGRVIEDRPTGELLTDPAHPVTRELLGAIPRLTAREPAMVAP